MQFQTAVILFTIILSTSFNIKPVLSSRASFGEFCDRSLRCDTSAALTCQNNTCICLKPEAMWFDTSRDSCVALAGEKCKFTVVEDFRSWLEEVNCIENSDCTPVTGLCTCEPNFTESANGSCIPRKLFGNSCKTKDDCRTDLSLNCIKGECKCDPDVSIYNFDLGHCVGLAEKPCLQEQCTANAACRGFYGGHTADSYEEYSGEDTKCYCVAGYTMSAEGLCQVGHGGTCDIETQCIHKFKCEEGKCTCKFPSHQSYEEKSQSCYSLVGGPCTPSKNVSMSGVQNPIYCSKPAVCSPKGTFRHECSCPDGMVESADRHCELTHGRICQTEKERGTSSGLKCDQLAPLYCIEGKCQCEDELKLYDTRVKKCRGLVGSTCKMGDEGRGFCTDGAVCKAFRGSETIGICECLKTFVETSHRTCVALSDSLVSI